ncbi:ABC transporter ATP-binding protein [Demetria terragena]|uniref:ABC transporter ATP-binding protein n=1 Tax=Demetria terragena TaxID=63959 RepID=UPI000368322C|nr:ABC transporter ATP-binding protein [Demetria terragena]
MMNSTLVDIAVSARAVVVARGKNRVLHSLTFDLPTGTITGLMGPSGCGKTTLMRTIVGVQHLSGGDLHVLGQAAASAGLRRRLGYVTQAVSVYRDLTVRDNVRYFAALHATDPAEVERAIDMVGLTSQTTRRVENLSGGQASRASLACALVGSPELLVLDEPTVGLDPVTREDLWTSLRDLADSGVTMLVSSHVMDEATRCDGVLLMRDGRLLAHLTPQQMLDRTGTQSPDQAFLQIIRDDQGTAA